MRPPEKSRVVMAALFVLTVLLFLAIPLLKAALVPAILPVLPPSALPIVLPIVQPVQIPRTMLHDDKPVVSTQAPISALAVVMCDGDGVSGNRVQVMYVHAQDVPDRFADVQAPIQQWATDVDAVFSMSAAETGGTRHVRYVHDVNCIPSVLDVQITSTGDDSFLNTVSDLQALGYNRTDRKYLLFMDAGTYCGIADVQSDDRNIADNMNNTGPHYAWVGAQCWSQTAAAHELMHTLGAVQVTAPHSSQEFHCWDMDDLMCRPTNGWPTQQLCAYPGYLHFDCNHDDYYSTNPPPDSWLALHWNTANNKFLIGAPQPTPTPTPCFHGNSGKPCK